MLGEAELHAAVTDILARCITRAPATIQWSLRQALSAADKFHPNAARSFLAEAEEVKGPVEVLSWAILALADGRAVDVARVLLDILEYAEATRLLEPSPS